MTNNELIITDLCAKSQYNLFVQRGGRARKVLAVYPNSNRIVLDNSPYMPQTYSVDEVIPYLRPLSSMSGDEIYSVAGIVIPGLPHNIDETKGTCSVCCHDHTDEIELDFSVRDLANGIYGIEGLDWLNEHHFDYRGLIEKGLAIEAPNDMYNN